MKKAVQPLTISLSLRPIAGSGIGRQVWYPAQRRRWLYANPPGRQTPCFAFHRGRTGAVDATRHPAHACPGLV